MLYYNKPAFNGHYKKVAGEHIPEENIFSEPDRKNTAACIAYTTLLLKKRYKEGVLCFVPADGYVKDTESYAGALQLAFDTAERTNGLVIIGVKPTYPADGYGYIHVEPVTGKDVKISRVLNFIEKPTLEVAEAYPVLTITCGTAGSWWAQWMLLYGM